MIRYRDAETRQDAASGALRVTARLENHGGTAWPAIGWQVYDPETGLFIQEGDWQPLGTALEPRGPVAIECRLQLPPQDGPYRVYISPLDANGQWLYARGGPLLVVDAEVRGGVAQAVRTQVTTLRALRRANIIPALRRLVTQPVVDIVRNRRLIGSLVRREILARYRGSFGDAAWTILHPLLLILTYFFVFGVVLESRFGNDPSRTGFALYFLAGIIPWLAFSEALGRASLVILEHRSFVKKLVFPVAVLPVNLVASGLITGAILTVLFGGALVAVRGAIPATAVALPLLIVPQVLLTLGLAWFLAALGVFLRDLAQVMGFLLTLWFFLTPICYPETAVPAALAPLLHLNPMYTLVRGYRMVLLEAVYPDAGTLLRLWLLAVFVFFAGHAWFHRLQRSFADVV